jgi:hypothetical protein
LSDFLAFLEVAGLGVGLAANVVVWEVGFSKLALAEAGSRKLLIPIKAVSIEPTNILVGFLIAKLVVLE